MLLPLLQGLPVYRTEGNDVDGEAKCHFGTQCFKDVTTLKPKEALNILRKVKLSFLPCSFVLVTWGLPCGFVLLCVDFKLLCNCN